MPFGELITTMAAAIARGDGAAAAACFHDEGVYHDVFYGAFPKADIPRMVSDFFHRDATNFIWDMHDPVSDGRIGYARYVFSYDGLVPGSEGRRALFEGVSICTLRDDRLLTYHEVANTATGLHGLGFPAARLERIVARQAEALAARDEAAHHRARG
ncbi:MAG: nuclear transport factor 2 family protein [Gammaproteobacteria bacterium]